MVARLCERLGVPHATLAAEWAGKPDIGDPGARPRRTLPAARRVAGRARAGCAGDRSSRRRPGRNSGHAPQPRRRRARPRGDAARRPGSGQRPAAAPPAARLAPGRARAASAPTAGTRARGRPEQPATRDIERVRVRRDISAVGWLDPEAVARSAAHLADADEALDWAAEQEWDRGVTDERTAQIVYRPAGAPGRNRPADRRARDRSARGHEGARPSPCAAASSTICSKRSAAGASRDACAECAMFRRRRMEIRSGPHIGLDLWITAVKIAFNDSGDSLAGRGAWNRTTAFFVGAQTKK